jgi:hypothetical protein
MAVVCCRLSEREVGVYQTNGLEGMENQIADCASNVLTGGRPNDMHVADILDSPYVNERGVGRETIGRTGDRTRDIPNS